MINLQQVYDIVRNGTVDAVVRVASPAFPKDKLESEVGKFWFLLVCSAMTSQL